ncbi:hypothetical protein EDB86DRAFT_3082295 [Lactarius hatsudake]|nr:hypothetical protein EDB86DRAFT_3082295 [Lactarius hatsudake]
MPSKDGSISGSSKTPLAPAEVVRNPPPSIIVTPPVGSSGGLNRAPTPKPRAKRSATLEVPGAPSQKRR